MKALVSFILAVAIPVLSSGQVTRLSAKHRKALEDASRFRQFYSTTNLPTAVIALCADQNGRLANPAQKWQATDVINEPGLPRKRLAWAATDGQYNVVHYIRDGIGFSIHILVARLIAGDNKASFLWHGVGHHLKDYEAFVAALKGDSLDDSRDYAR